MRLGAKQQHKFNYVGFAFGKEANLNILLIITGGIRNSEAPIKEALILTIRFTDRGNGKCERGDNLVWVCW